MFYFLFQDTQQVCMDIMEPLRFAMHQLTSMIMAMLKMIFTQDQRVYTPNLHLCQDLHRLTAPSQCTPSLHHLAWITTTGTSLILKAYVPNQALTLLLFLTLKICTKTTHDVTVFITQVSQGLWNLSQCTEHHTVNKMILEIRTTQLTEAQQATVLPAPQTQDPRFRWVEHALTISLRTLWLQLIQVLLLQTQQVCVTPLILSTKMRKKTVSHQNSAILHGFLLMPCILLAK